MPTVIDTPKAPQIPNVPISQAPLPHPDFLIEVECVAWIG